MTSKKRIIILSIIDALSIMTTVTFAYYILYPYFISFDSVFILTIIVLLFSHFSFVIFRKNYGIKWRYANLGEMSGIFSAVTLSTALVLIFQWGLGEKVEWRAISIIWMMYILTVGGSRLVWRYYNKYGISFQMKRRKQTSKIHSNARRTVIVGAGAAGQVLADQMHGDGKDPLHLIGFVDDNPDLQHMTICGLPVLGRTSQLTEIVGDNEVEQVVLALHPVDSVKVMEIVRQIHSKVKSIQFLPMIEDIVTGKAKMMQGEVFSIEDLLGRPPVELNVSQVREDIEGQTVMVTGAGGSIGSEICRQLAGNDPERIILLGRGEFSIYSIHGELRERFPHVEFLPVIADIQDRERIFQVMEEYKPIYVYHAAAHKHVPLMEGNPKEAFKNNVLGTKNVAEAADREGVKRFVLVSTDKAVNPTNIMGGTKRLAEMVIQTLNNVSSTEYVAVRFGNVFGSRGSVIPLFRKQIERGGPITVTHPQMTRYFMTIPEAASLVLVAGSLTRGGEIFVLDMGEPVRIQDLAKKLIKMTGFCEDDIQIQYTGIRPGEKMHEELLDENEIQPNQIYPKIYLGRNVDVPDMDLFFVIENDLKHTNPEDIKAKVLEIVNGNKEEVQLEATHL